MTHPSHFDPELKILNDRFTPCGLNNDWCVAAWYCSDREPQQMQSLRGIFIIDGVSEHGDQLDRYYVIERLYNHDEPGLHIDNELAGPLTAEQAIEKAEHHIITEVTS